MIKTETIEGRYDKLREDIARIEAQHPSAWFSILCVSRGRFRATINWKETDGEPRQAVEPGEEHEADRG